MDTVIGWEALPNETELWFRKQQGVPFKYYVWTIAFLIACPLTAQLPIKTPMFKTNKPVQMSKHALSIKN